MLGEEAVVIGMQGRESVADDLSLVCRAERVLLMDFIDVQGTETIGIGLQGRETVVLHVVDGLSLVCRAERLLCCHAGLTHAHLQTRSSCPFRGSWSSALRL